MSPFLKGTALSLLAIALAACERTSLPHDAGRESVATGNYRAVLQLPGGELPFGLDLEREQSGWVGYLINGQERLKLNEVAVNGTHLEIRMPGYENRLTANAQGGNLQGEVVLSKPGGKNQHLPLHAEYKQSYRFFPQTPVAGADVTGRWSVTFFADDGSEEAAVGEFSQSNGLVTGTFLTNGGDHRYLSGQVRGDQLYLSTFDGAHAFLYEARITGPADALTGDFWYGTAVHERWTAKRDVNATLPDAGFSGPATGEHYDQFVTEFRRHLDQLLAEPPGGT
jgi:hypothetical protein